MKLLRKGCVNEVEEVSKLYGARAEVSCGHSPKILPKNTL